MFRLEKRFTLPIGHRLSKHKGRCSSIHGHNFTILVGVMADRLNQNDMIIDFSDLKALVNEYLDMFDHCLLLNLDDVVVADQLKEMGMRVIVMKHEPTAERLAERLFINLSHQLLTKHPNVFMDYVTVYENENSKATYSEN